MSRRNISKKRFPQPDSVYNSYLVSLLIARILKAGKKNLAKKIVNNAFNLIKSKTKAEPLDIFEKAIKNVSPLMKIKTKRVGGSNYQIPIEVNSFTSTLLSLRWIIKYARERNGRKMSIRLANEIIDASKGTGNSIKKKEETHKTAETNKAFSHYRY